MRVESSVPEGNVASSGSMTRGRSPGASSKVSLLSSKPTLVVHGPMRFLIMDAPRQSNLHLYIKECKKHNVSDIVRVCEPTYTGESDLRNAGITLHEMAYDDGTSPPKDVLSEWLDLVQKRFINKGKGSAVAESLTNGEESLEKTIAVHCVAGLGRAPVLVAIALIEFGGYDPVDAVTFIRKHRRGAINEKQLQYLEQYKRKTGGGCSCVIS